jgi:Zn-dependent protease with chaperone function
MDMPLGEALAAARQHLPAWVCWAPLLYVPVAFLVGLILTSLVAIVAVFTLRRVPNDAHWTERARYAYPARKALNMTLWLSVLVSAALAAFCAGDLFPFSRKTLACGAGLAAFLGSIGPTLLASRRIRRRSFGLGEWCRWIATYWMLFGSPFLVAIAAFALLPAQLDAWALTVLALAAAALLSLLFGGAIRACQALGLVWPPSSRLSIVVEMAAVRVGTRPKAVYEIDLGQANGAALPLAGTLLVSRTALEILDDEELASLCAHELGHLSEPRIASIARVLPALLLLSLAALPTVGWIRAAFPLLVLFFAMTFLHRMWRRMEQRSDRVALAQERASGVFARQLEKLYEFSLVPAVMSSRKTIHPHLYDRLLAAGVTPAYPRPKPPSTFLPRLAMLSVLVPAAGAAFVISDSSGLAAVIGRSSETAVEWRLALLPQTAGDLSNLARLRAARGDYDSAIVFTRAATYLDVCSSRYPAYLAIYLGRADRCAEAKQALVEARRRGDCGDEGQRPFLSELFSVARTTCALLEKDVED